MLHAALESAEIARRRSRSVCEPLFADCVGTTIANGSTRLCWCSSEGYDDLGGGRFAVSATGEQVSFCFRSSCTLKVFVHHAQQQNDQCLFEVKQCRASGVLRSGAVSTTKELCPITQVERDSPRDGDGAEPLRRGAQVRLDAAALFAPVACFFATKVVSVVLPSRMLQG